MIINQFKEGVTITDDGIKLDDVTVKTDGVPNLDDAPKDPIAPVEPVDKPIQINKEREDIINALPADIETYDITDIDLQQLDAVEIQEGDSIVKGFKTADGHIIDATGKILLTARQIYDNDNPVDTGGTDDTLFTIDNVAKLSGIELTDESGAPLVFENNPAGFAAREAKIQEIAINTGKQQAINDFFAQHEDIKDIFEYKVKNGTVANYSPSTNLLNVTITRDDVEALETMIVQAQVAKGDSLERAQRFVNYSKGDNKLYEDGIEAQTFLKNKVDSENLIIQKDRQSKANDYYGFTFEGDKEIIFDTEGSLYNNIITKGQIGDFKIPQTGIKVKQADGTLKQLSRRDILNYIALAADDQGNSQAELDFNSRLAKKDEKLLLYLTTLMHGDLSQLSNELVNRDKIQKNKQIITIQKQSGTPSNGNPNRIVKYILPVNK